MIPFLVFPMSSLNFAFAWAVGVFPSGHAERYKHMNTPTPYKKYHWNFINFLSRRILGIAFILVPLFMLLTVFLDTEREWYSGSIRVIMFFLMPLIILLGYLLIRSKPYYPKKYHDYFQSIGKIK